MIHRATVQEYRDRNPDKIKAQSSIANAVRDGKILRKPCEKCGNPVSQAHHPDYSKPLEVVWLCVKHHREIHRRNTDGHGEESC
jgi:uncharacterized OB-fold protein